MATQKDKSAEAKPIGNPEQGFTLLEVLVALAILGMSMSALLSSQMQAIRASSYAQGLTAAVYLADYQLVELEWEQRKEGWVENDVNAEGDFSDQGWPEIRYECLVDFIELPEYNEMVNAKTDADAEDGDAYQDAGDQAFSALGLVWPMIKSAIENSIRKAKCKAIWSDGDEEYDYEVETFWTDAAKLRQLPSFGGEAGGESSTPPPETNFPPSNLPNAARSFPPVL